MRATAQSEFSWHMTTRAQRTYLSYCTLDVRLIAVDFASGEAPAGLCLEASDEQAFLHGGVQQDGTHAGHSELVGYKALQNV